MCLSPISIPNQSKFVSLRHHDRFLMQVPCGNCAECQQTLSNQWYYRAFYEWQDLCAAGGYCLFDTLTYSDKYLPHLSDTWTNLPHSADFPCFNYSHLRKFLQVLRVRLIRAGYSKNAFRYFASSEYGSDSRFTHRPHMHLLLFVYDTRIDPIYLSRLIADVWYYGRTDGVPWKSALYVTSHNYISSSALLSQKLRTIKYVTKYVQKTCVFQKELNWRISKVMFSLACIADPVTPDKWLETEYAHREKLKLLRFVNQFHRQSQHFGETALRDMDYNQIVRDGCLYMPDCDKVMIPVPIPTYYKRKLFYEQVYVGGSRYWQINELGLEFNAARSQSNLLRLRDRYNCLCIQHNLSFDSLALADYTLNRRGYILSDGSMSTLLERVRDVDIFNYSTGSDKLQFGCRGLSSAWLGDSQTGYFSSRLHGRVPLSSFIQRYVYFDPVFESQLDKLYVFLQSTNIGKQGSFEIKQRLKNAFKVYK